ncbi:alcohol dehydrogenase family protein [Nisaea sp.]|uniref:alcohol dehydrogenase family protein n=1 Tax=Nisaea sp. TaxID=2024842 RepID=UPI003B52F526
MTMTYPPAKMQAVLLTGHGDFDKLAYRTDITVPVPGPRDVLVRVGAAGVNNTDLNTRIGWYSKGDNDAVDASWGGEALEFPRIQGADIAGEIIAVGTGIDPARVGERVLVEPCLRELHGQTLDNFAYIGSECDGGFADFVVVPGSHAFRLESGLSDVELASFPCSYSTAENLLTRTDVKAGERVLVTGASGGVGSAAIQLARARGAEVIAVTSPAKADHLMALGTAQIIDRNTPPSEVLGANAVDVVVDLVGGPTWPDLLETLRPGGRYGVSGAIGGHTVPLDLRTLYLKDLKFFGCTKLEDGVFAKLVRLIESGAIRPLVAATFPLREIVAAQKAFSAKSHTGKIVLEVAGTA